MIDGADLSTTHHDLRLEVPEAGLPRVDGELGGQGGRQTAAGRARARETDSERLTGRTHRQTPRAGGRDTGHRSGWEGASVIGRGQEGASDIETGVVG